MKNEFKVKNINIKSNFGKKKVKSIRDEIKYTSEKPLLEQDCNDEMNFFDKKFAENKNKEIKSFKDQTSTAYHTCIYFKTEEQKLQFYKLANLLDLVDTSGRFIKGEDFADRLGIKIDKIEIKAKIQFSAGKRFNNENEFSYI
jgi:hypothetical protein